MRLRNLSVLGATVILAATACNSTPAATTKPSTGPSGTPAGSAGSPAAGMQEIKIGIELPMTGGEAPNGVPTANGVALALEQLAASVPGYHITIEQKDDALNGKHDPQTGASNMQALVNDPSVM